MKSILIIEDNIEILENMAEYFELEGYRTFSTNNAERGIEMALEFNPDLIICDMPLPGIDGRKVLGLLLNAKATCEIPFIFCTTLCEKINKLEALEQGADDYIFKPFHLEQILEKVKSCIQSGSKRHKYLA